MIRLRNLHKYFNKNKQNEIHVINDTNLLLPDKGLVMLVGPSGSGKTTLLNVLGGLDKVTSGAIEFDNTIIEKYNTKTWDLIRNKEVGYIFQNYNLLKNLTVYENIELTLNMIGIYDKDEIDRRIDYILDSMGMINYRKRRASQLSGGQQQRVAIARALAKNPSVIIADEPTGNLDSKNTQDIMRIIKSISFNKLVVLVTHEKELASQYADRIIELKDGVIVKDEDHSATGASSILHDTDIYLQDLEKTSNFEDGILSVESYSDEPLNENINIRLIAKNKTLYIDVETKQFKKMNLIGKDSEVRIFNDSFKKEEKEVFDTEGFDLATVINVSKEEHIKHSVISVKESVKFAFRRMRSSSRIGKLFYVGFALGAVLIALAVGMLSGIYRTEPETFVNYPVETIQFYKEDNTYNDILALENIDSVEYINYIDTAEIKIDLPTVFQTVGSNQTFTQQVVYSDYLDASDIILGRPVADMNEFVVNEYVANQILNSSNMNYIGITSLDDLLSIGYHANVGGIEYEMKLVGIADTNNPVIYMKEATALMVGTGIGVVDVFESELVGAPEVKDILVDSNFTDTEIFIASGLFPVNGTYEAKEDLPYFMVSLNVLKQEIFNTTKTLDRSTITLFSSDLKESIDELDVLGIEASSTYATDLQEYKDERIEDSLPTITFTLVVLAASAISYFFIIRSSLLSRIYEISVYRALGVPKGDIRKMFVTEIVFITTITSLIGYIAMTIILWRIQILAENFLALIYISPLSVVAGIVLIYLVNIVSGLIPVSNLLRRTPAEILSKYDF